MQVPSPVPPLMRLGIAGLTSLTDRMTNGGMYALIAETSPARYPILASSLASALSEGASCTAIVPGQPEIFLDRVEAFGGQAIGEALEQGQLQVFVPQDNFAKKIFRFGTDAFTRELDFFHIPENSYLIFDQADELLSLHDISIALEQVEVLRQWFGQRNITALLVFSRATSTGAIATLRDLMDRLAGIARVGGSRDGLELTFDYWQSPEGTVAAKHYPLQTLESGLYRAGANDTAPAPYAPSGIDGGDETRYFFNDPDLIALGRQMPGIWQYVDTLVGILHATQRYPGATVILSFKQDTGLRQLAEAVHTLRHSLGRRARIVIQEKNASLRYQNEALLLRLGINLVVHRDVPASRLPLLLESLKGQVFDRDVGIDFEAALASAMPSSLKGYLQPARFARETQSIVERAVTLNIPCSLVIATPGRDLDLIDILTRVEISRPGDLLTADRHNCYLFLSGCPEANLLSTLERVLGRPVNACFEQTRFVIARHELEAELAALARSAEQGGLPDYSGHLQNAQGMAADNRQRPQAAADQRKPSPAGMFSRPANDRGSETAAVRPLFPAAGPHADEPTADASPTMPAGEDTPEASQDEVLRYRYGGRLTHPSTFGKNEAPRATRAIPRKDPQSR